MIELLSNPIISACLGTLLGALIGSFVTHKLHISRHWELLDIEEAHEKRKKLKEHQENRKSCRKNVRFEKPSGHPVLRVNPFWVEESAVHQYTTVRERPDLKLMVPTWEPTATGKKQQPSGPLPQEAIDKAKGQHHWLLLRLLAPSEDCYLLFGTELCLDEDDYLFEDQISTTLTR